MTRRYFAPDLPLVGGPLELTSNEAQHAIRVMRLKEGDEIELFDGKGRQSHARVAMIDRKTCLCDADAATEISREAAVHLHLFVSLPKPDRAKELVERLTELGVAKLTPITTQRSQRAVNDGLIEKLDRIVIEASKQCGRNHLMTIAPPLSLSKAIEGSAETPNRWILHTAPTPNENNTESCFNAGDAETIAAFVGPEGGWAPEEVELAIRSGLQTRSLGNRVLRIETAASAIAALVCCNPSLLR